MIRSIKVKTGSGPNRRMRTVMVQEIERRSFSGRGRKRKEGPRETNGRAQRQPKAETRERALSIVAAQRARLVPKDKVDDVRAECPLGVYEIKGLLGYHEAEAGREYARLVAAVRRDYDAPLDRPKPAGLSRWVRSESDPAGPKDRHYSPETGRRIPDEELYDIAQLTEIVRQRRKKHAAAFDVLMGCGRGAVVLVNRVALREEYVSPLQVGAVKRALSRLASHFGIRSREGG